MGFKQKNQTLFKKLKILVFLKMEYENHASSSTISLEYLKFFDDGEQLQQSQKDYYN